MSELLKARIDIPCPRCGRKFNVTLRDLQSGRTATCPSGHRVKLREQGDGVRSADRAVDNFKRAIQRLNRRVK